MNEFEAQYAAKENRPPSQTADTLYMVFPDHFGFNAQTAPSNSFQHETGSQEEEIRTRAQREFNSMVDTLRSKDINIVVGRNPIGLQTPDAIFPNNWFTTHEDGTLITYPMFAANRREERHTTQLIKSLSENGFEVKGDPYPLHLFEKSGEFLEGTGSLVLDRVAKVAFAQTSPRTSQDALFAFCEKLGYDYVMFDAVDRDGNPIYHTNVVMSVGKEFAVICQDAIASEKDKERVLGKLSELGKEIIPITYDQMKSFCGNILEVSSSTGDSRIVMSKTAFDAFTESQKEQLSKFGQLVPVEIPTIEEVGGGSARCMIAEIHLPQAKATSKVS